MAILHLGIHKQLAFTSRVFLKNREALPGMFRSFLLLISWILITSACTPNDPCQNARVADKSGGSSLQIPIIEQTNTIGRRGNSIDCVNVTGWRRWCRSSWTWCRRASSRSTARCRWASSGRSSRRCNSKT